MNSISGGTIQNTKSRLMIVSAIFDRLEKRLWRTHPTTPVVAAGADFASTGVART
jgi:hypothetical protein